MKHFKISQAAQATKGEYTAEGEITDVVIDTRLVTKGCLFICIKGERFDGHDFAADAVKAGAGCVMASKPMSLDVPVITVEDTSKALLDLASFYRGMFNIPLVGLTGSVGKTTTKDFIHCVLSSKYNAIKTQGNLNNEIGVPRMLFQVDDSTEAAVIEMGMNHFGEIHKLTLCARPTAAVITNIGVSHIENLGSREGILKSKLEILDGLQDGAPLILNSDNDMLAKVCNIGHPIITFGIESGDYRAVDIKTLGDKTEMDIVWDDKKVHTIIPAIGTHNVYNALAAFVVGMSLGIEPEECAKAISTYTPSGMRQKIVHLEDLTVIEDCYNASPDSMKACISSLMSVGTGRKIAVLADMLELGDYSKKAHSDVGEMAAQMGVDIMLAYGENAVYYVEQGKKCGIKEAYHFDTKDELATKLLSLLQKGDTVAFKGSRGMKLEDVIKTVYDRWENK